MYVMTMVGRNPRQIAGFDIVLNRSWDIAENIVGSAPPAKKYCSDGWHGYLDVHYPGEYVRNMYNKKDTYTVESVNADLRTYIPLLKRRSRCFPRSLETLKAVVGVFAHAYNLFGIAKAKYQQLVQHKPNSNLRHSRKYRDHAFSVFNFF